MNRILFRVAILLLRFVEFNLAADLLIGAIFAMALCLRKGKGTALSKRSPASFRFRL